MQHCPKTCFPCAADITTNHEEVYKCQAGTTVACNMEEGPTLKTQIQLARWPGGVRALVAHLDDLIPIGWRERTSLHVCCYDTHTPACVHMCMQVYTYRRI